MIQAADPAPVHAQRELRTAVASNESQSLNFKLSKAARDQLQHSRLPGIGQQVNGAYLGVNIGPISFQPAEFAKIGIVIFLVGSALSGLSQNMGMLILFRGIQGIGAGALFPVALAIIGDLFTPKERGKYQGLFGAVFGIAFVVGPLVGGFLTENFGWHWIFYVNIPIGIVALIVIQRLLPTVKRSDATLL